MPAEGPGAELVSAACKAAREDSPGMAGGDALATGYVTAEPQACKQARESFGRAASGAPSQLMGAAFARGSATSLATLPRQEGQCGRVERVEHEEHELSPPSRKAIEFGPLE